ncbi:unnamed protein product [Trichogramma brassicae]|uniref:Uncharacterized protein n=1 Tax=Trichogramma brassicae TaxID=86971 RepID=A0A6H5IPD8_9HYME|nr:unnamed protein product [Trichogramma brassicae]
MKSSVFELGSVRSKSERCHSDYNESKYDAEGELQQSNDDIEGTTLRISPGHRWSFSIERSICLLGSTIHNFILHPIFSSNFYPQFSREQNKKNMAKMPDRQAIRATTPRTRHTFVKSTQHIDLSNTRESKLVRRPRSDHINNTLQASQRARRMRASHRCIMLTSKTVQAVIVPRRFIARRPCSSYMIFTQRLIDMGPLYTICYAVVDLWRIDVS